MISVVVANFFWEIISSENSRVYDKNYIHPCGGISLSNRSILGRNMASRTWSPFETRESFELGTVLTDRLLIRRNAIP